MWKEKKRIALLLAIVMLAMTIPTACRAERGAGGEASGGVAKNGEAESESTSPSLTSESMTAPPLESSPPVGEDTDAEISGGNGEPTTSQTGGDNGAELPEQQEQISPSESPSPSSQPYEPATPTYEESLNAAMDAYGQVLRNEEKIYFPTQELHEEQDSEMLLIEYFIKEQYYDPVFGVFNFTIVEMDGDGMPEVIVEWEANGLRVVLHYNDGIVYGHIFPYKSMTIIKKDGTFDWMQGAANGGIAMLEFTGRYCELVDLFICDSTQYDESDLLLINGVSVSLEEWYSTFSNWRELEDVEWHELNDENIAAYFEQ